MTKSRRLMDITLAAILAIMLAPLILGIAVLILVVDGRPLLFGGTRVRFPGQNFRLWKFRTMAPDPADTGVTGGDKNRRITRTGRFLRRTRLDELPQLWNILRGDISFVGPRPPLPRYVEMFPDIYAAVLEERPGVTGLATLVYHRTEERLLAACSSPEETERTYIRRCIPRKARIDLIYAARSGLGSDLALIFATCTGRKFRRFRKRSPAPRQPVTDKRLRRCMPVLAATVGIDSLKKSVRRHLRAFAKTSGSALRKLSGVNDRMIHEIALSLTRKQKSRILLAIDAISVWLAFLGAAALTAGALASGTAAIETLRFPTLLTPVAILLTISFGLHRNKLNAYELKGILESAAIAVTLGLVGAVINMLPGARVPAQTFIVMAMAYAIVSIGARLVLRALLVHLYTKHRPRTRVLIYGAGQTGQQLAAALGTDDTYVPVAFIDDNPNLQGLTIGGVRVFGPARLMQLINRERISHAVLAMPSARAATRAAISQRLRDAGCQVHSVPSFAELLVEGNRVHGAQAFPINDLLGRTAFNESLPEVNGAYRKRRVLVTGAGGSIGTELCRQLLKTAPERLVLLDHSELALYEITRELQALEHTCEIVPVLGSITNAALMRRIMDESQVEVVLHAAAYKHLPIVQNNIVSGVYNNVLGTQIVAEAALAAGVERFVLVSSDKAVRPTSAMGASKRMAELVIQNLAEHSKKTRFSMVRFGNVMGSSGSVLPLFQEQINAGGPVTLTHKDATRYFMTVPEAASLVLLAGTFARGGEVFVLDMGKPIRIFELARQMIRNAGYTIRDNDNPDGDIEIVEIGLRAGEKVHEELLIGSDMLTTPHPKILRAQESCLSHVEFEAMLADLWAAVATANDAMVQRVIDKWVASGDQSAGILHDSTVADPPNGLDAQHRVKTVSCGA